MFYVDIIAKFANITTFFKSTTTSKVSFIKGISIVGGRVVANFAKIHLFNAEQS